MTSSSLRAENREYWSFQIVGWSTLTLLTYLSLTLWYNPGQWTPALHTIVQSVLGIFVSHPMRSVGLRTWNARVRWRLSANASAILIAALVWTILRLATFTALTGEMIGPEDWGGWFFASVIVFGCWSFCFHALRYNRLWQDEQRVAIEATALAHREALRRLEAENASHTAELRFLRHQLSPHFLFNVLNSVSALVAEGDQKSATLMISRIGDFLRTSLDGDLHHPLRDELDIVELYLGIERVRFGDRITTEFDIEPAALDQVVPSLMLQPLFENSIKHAVGRTLSPVQITLRAEIVGDRLDIQVSDDGPGAAVAADEIETSGGVGLCNVRRRLASNYGDDFVFEMRPGLAGKGLTVALSLPLGGTLDI